MGTLIPTLHNTRRQPMQFTYEREDNNYCWLTDTLTFTKDIIHHHDRWVGRGSLKVGNKQSCVKVDKLLDYLNLNRLTLDNFPGLKDYLKENYPEILFKESKDIDYKKLLENLVRLIESDIDSINHYSNSELGKAEEFKAACLALNSDWYLGKHLE